MKKRVEKVVLALIVILAMAFPSYAASLSKTSVNMKVGDTVNISSYGVNGTWSSNMPSVATVDSGKVTAISAGTAVISLSTEDGQTYDCVINISGNIVSRADVHDYIVSDSNKDGDNVLLPGYYVLKSEAGKFGSYTITSPTTSTGIKDNGTITGDTIIQLESGDRINIGGCSIEALSGSTLNSATSGEFEVGRHIQSGEYIVETDNTYVGSIIIYSDISKTNILTVYDISQSTPYKVKLVDGQCVGLSGCKLVG